MTREEALKVATEHASTIGTNARGYQDGVQYRDKVDAAERFARFLMEGAEPETVQIVATGDETILHLSAERLAFLRRLLTLQLDDGPCDDDANAAAFLRDLNEA